MKLRKLKPAVFRSEILSGQKPICILKGAIFGRECINIKALNISFLKYFPVIAIAALGFFVYSATYKYPFEFDDYTNILANQNIKNLADLKAIFSFWPARFITYFSLALNYHFGKLDVFGYHVFNIVTHICAALLVRWFVLLIFSAPAIKKDTINNHANFISLFCGLIFVCHPLQTQAVTYIIQRATSLASFFYLASLCLYLKSRLLHYEKKYRNQQVFYYIGSLVSGIAAMFTKELAITLPLAIFLCEYCFLKDKKHRIGVKYASAFVAISLVIPVTMLATKSVLLPHLRMVSDLPCDVSSYQYLLTQFRVLITYLRLFIMPLNQSLDYDYLLAEGLFQPNIILSLCFLLILTFIAIKLFSKYRIISFSIFWFFLAISPESSVIPIKDVIFEHRMYLPMVGLGLFLSASIYYLLGRTSRLPAAVMLSMIIFLYAGLAYARNFVWRDELVLWNDAVAVSGKARAYEYRGTMFLTRGFYDEAISDYNKAIAKDPNNGSLCYKRGVAYFFKKDYDKSYRDLMKSSSLGYDVSKDFMGRFLKARRQGL